jgi:small subunit ribosomal protein S17
MKTVVVVEVISHKPHPLYRKLLKRSKRFKAVLDGKDAGIGDLVKIADTRPVASDTHFKVVEVIRKSRESQRGEKK